MKRYKTGPTPDSRARARVEKVRGLWDRLEPRLPDPALFDGLSREERVRWFAYLYRIPSGDRRPELASGHVLGLYDPFARRSRFAAGVRLSCNVYVGCIHACRYCYSRLYTRCSPGEARRKTDFRERLQKDLALLKAYELPPVPLHASISTDPFQESLESRFEDTLYLLETLTSGAARQFTSIRILTRNPARASDGKYIDALQFLAGQVAVQVSLPIRNEKSARFYEPGAPSPRARMQGIERLTDQGVPVMLRIDPLFPRDPLPDKYFEQNSLQERGIVPGQSEGDLRQLVDFAADSGCTSIITSALKIPVRGGYCDRDLREMWEPLYREAATRFPGGIYGNYLRLPEEYQREVLFAPLHEQARARGIKVQHCKQNLVQTR